MDNYFKYLTCNPEDLSWGIYLTVAGRAELAPGSAYPPRGHPKGYHFNWVNGRVLKEYQINYITQGEGVMETQTGKFTVKPGMVIILRPDLWHRYKPVKEKGWTEHYIGFKGEIAERIIGKNTLLNRSPLIHIGFHKDVLDDFNGVLDLVRNEKPGYQQVAAGLLMHILGRIVSTVRGRNFSGSSIEDSIQKACLVIRDNVNRPLRIEQLARDLDINYSLFRKAFKKYTGLSPNQYLLSLRIAQAANLLISSQESIKNISSGLGFCSVYYFSKLFRIKTGQTPGAYRASSLPAK